MMLIGSFGYGFAAAAFGLLALLMLTSWRGRLQGGLLVTAAAFSAAWAAVAAYPSDTPGHWQLLGILEVLRNVSWLVFLARLTPAGQGIVGISRHLTSFAPAAFVLVYGLGSLLFVAAEIIPHVIRTLVLTGLVTAIAGLVLLEQVYRSLRSEPRKAVLPLVVGLGALLAYDLFLYSHGLLFKAIHAELWAARGFANLLAVPMLLLAARRNPGWSVDVFVSRHIAFYTTSVVAIGVYLVVMSIAGYGLRVAGGEWGTILQVVFFFGAVILLALIIFSAAVRAQLKVFIAKHFYSNKYDYREEWLKLTRRLSEGEEGEPLPQRGLNALVELAGAEGGALWTGADGRDGEGYRRLATTGKAAESGSELNFSPASPDPKFSSDPNFAPSSAAFPDTIPNDDPLIEFLAERRWTVNLAEAVRNPDAHPGLFIPGWLEELGPNALVVPLLNQDRLWGVVVLTGPKRIGRLSYEDIDLYRVAGIQIAAVLAQAAADRLLTESRQFEAFNRFAAFIMHDLKNVIAQQSLVVRNAAKYRDDPAFIDDALDTVANSVERMQRLLEQLKRGEGQAQVERVEVNRLIIESVRKCTEREPVPTAESLPSTLRLRVDRERLAAVLGHILANAQDATPADGSVRIETALEADGGLVIAVVDTGCGMEEEFIRERLFKPFDSTKGTKGMGIGAYQARQFVQALGGDVRIASTPGAGTRFELCFPAAVVEQEGAAPSNPAPSTPAPGIPTKEASHGA
jgi:signal transduction histidine kinase